MFKCLGAEGFGGDIPQLCSKFSTKKSTLGLQATGVPLSIVYYHSNQWPRNRRFPNNDTPVAGTS